MNCTNCDAETQNANYLALTHGGRTVALICSACQQNVSLAKLVIRREVGGEVFSFEGYQPIIESR